MKIRIPKKVKKERDNDLGLGLNLGHDSQVLPSFF